MVAKARITRRMHLPILALYSGLAVLLTWPLTRYLTTHVPGDGIDDPALAWNLWWIKFRLVDQLNPDIFHSDWMFFPVQINLGFYTLTPLNGLISVPLQSSLGLIPTVNLLVLSTFVVGGYGGFLLVLHILNRLGLTGRYTTTIAALAGGVYAFASGKIFYVSLGQFNIASSHWIPFAVLYILRSGSGKDRVWRFPLLAGLFMAFQAWAELTYASFLVIFAALYFLWQLAIDSGRPSRLPRPLANLAHSLPPFLLMGLLFGLGITPFLWAMLPDLQAEGDFFASGGGFSDLFSADLLGYLVPTRLHPLLGAWTARLPFSNDKAQHIYAGYSVMFLAGTGLVALVRRGARYWFWPAITLFTWWLTLGPYVRWAGRELPIPGPFLLISRLPFFSGNRYPSRYGVLLFLCLAVLLAVGLAVVLRRRASSRSGMLGSGSVVLLAALLFLAEHVALPMPLSDFRTPALYEALARIPGDFTLLELPTGWRNGARVLGRSDLVIMMQQWYQTTHQKRRLGGNTSRNPPAKFQYYTEAPLLGELIGLMNSDRPHITSLVEEEFQEMVGRYRQAAPQILADLNIRYVTLHLERSPAPLIRFVEEALPVEPVDEWQGNDWSGQPATIRLYRVTERPASPARVLDLTQEAAGLALGAGWSALPDPQSRARYATRRDPVLLLPLPEEDLQVRLTMVGPARPVEAWVNGRPVTMRPDGQTAETATVVLSVPGTLSRDPIDTLQLYFDRTFAWNELVPPDEARGIPILAESAGEEVGDFARIYLAGRDVGLDGRGYNVIAVDQTGTLLDGRVFDTHADPAAATAMAAWLDQWPPGTLLVGAVNDEAARLLQGETVTALQGVGVQGDLRERFRWSHAWITRVGAPPSPQAEALRLLQPARVYQIFPLTAPRLSGGLRQIEWYTVSPP